MSEQQPFVLKAFFDEDELLGARWWNEAFVAHAHPARRQLLTAIAFVGGGTALAGFMAWRAARDDDDAATVDMESLALQRQSGWDFGADQTTLTFTNPVQLDAAGNPAWNRGLESLAAALAPRDPRLAPFEVPTLFQSLIGPSSAARLRQQLYPVFSDEMRAAHARGAALLDLTTATGAPHDVAVVVDLPGPQSVALAAALAPAFAPVFLLDNWPHPRGVVPAHQTLGAAVYYRPLFEQANATRPAGAPPVFVLDAARLAHYRDDPALFDNRYVVNLPSAAQLRRLGVGRLLYVRPSGQSLQELDDLNEDFVALDRGGLPVRAVALDDFERAVPDAGAPTTVVRYYYGGYPHTHVWFWHYHGWGPGPVYRSGGVRSTTPPPLPASLASRPVYRPAPRATMFSSRLVGGGSGIGKQKPSGFGRVSVRSSSSGFSARSGSFGRSRSSWSG